MIFILQYSFATQIEVKALSFYLDENAGKSTLSGNVEVKKGKDILNSDKLVIYMDKNKKPIKYEAIQNAKFEIYLEDKIYKGSGDRLIYNVLKDTYEINGNAIVNEVTTNKKIYGDKIVIDRKNNTYLVESKDKNPVRFVFDVEQK
nr:lipopolysaccharide transport periplasmic protein LptA [Campylobacter sp. 2018MI34]